MITMHAMIAIDVHLAIMEKIVGNHKSSLEEQFPLMVMMSGRNLLKLSECYAHMILVTPAINITHYNFYVWLHHYATKDAAEPPGERYRSTMVSNDITNSIVNNSIL